MGSDLLLVGLSMGFPLAMGTGRWVRTRVTVRAQIRNTEHARLTEWLPRLEPGRTVVLCRGDTGERLHRTEVTGEPGRHRLRD